MEQSNQKFSDLLSNRYKDLLKQDEKSLSIKPAQPNKLTEAENHLPATSPAPAPSAAPPLSVTPDTHSFAESAALHIPLAEKLRRFTERVATGQTYPSNQELAVKLGFDQEAFEALPAHKYRLMLDPNANLYEKISLQGEGGKNLFFRKQYAAGIFTHMFNSYVEERDNFKADDFIDDMLFNLIFSESQSLFDLDSEGSPRKAIESIAQKDGALAPPEQLLLNLYRSYSFLMENDITEENLFGLHKILTRHMDVKPARRYRTEELSVAGNLGDIALKAVSPQRLDIHIKKLFTYIDFSMSSPNPVDAFIVSQIIHYYFIYMSPYNEYNFTIARLLSSWYIIRHPNILYKPLFLSEALNRDRHTGKYLKAIKDSFDSGHDLTYFMNYLADIISAYSNAYIHLSKIIGRTQADSMNLSRSEERAIKVILLFPPIGERYFDWQKFKAYDQTHFSKQYYNRLLNSLIDKGVLTSRSKASKLYRLDYEKFEIS